MSDLDPCQSAYLLGVRDGMKAAVSMLEGVRSITELLQVDMTDQLRASTTQATCLAVLDCAEMIGKEAIS